MAELTCAQCRSSHNLTNTRSLPAICLPPISTASVQLLVRSDQDTSESPSEMFPRTSPSPTQYHRLTCTPCILQHRERSERRSQRRKPNVQFISTVLPAFACPENPIRACLPAPNPSFLISIHAGPNFFAFRVFPFPRLKTAVVYRMNENLGGTCRDWCCGGIF